MHLVHRIALTGAPLAALAAGPAAAQSVELTITVPRLTVAEYHRPYVAAYIEAPGKPAKTLAVWYDDDMKANEGTKWLRDVRQWWRASGRTMNFPADGVSGATRAPGTHKVVLTGGRGGLAGITPGQYTLVVEAAREAGGREVVRLPFVWPPKPAAIKGTSELGAVSIAPKR
ncbi:DUF2271 domain-containing protein [Sphingomonas sp.]|uniref:DUF2271 domain-containing protein n=1 Tax=Sphingomonas sp. TaxID=28214 RepID=UPI002DD633ED|nr:DUF2271 domain-containing protein [Sphingomonas sp.]